MLTPNYASTKLVTKNFLRERADEKLYDKQIKLSNTETLIKEFENLKIVPRCNIQQQDKIKFNLNNLNWKEIVSGAHSRFYDPETIDDLSCIVDALVLKHPTQSQGIAYNELLRRYISKLDKVGATSAYGNAYDAEINSISKLFLIKSPQRDYDENLLHEVFIGLTCLNALRTIGIMNFALIYGGFPCSKPVTLNNQVITWCNHESPAVNYAIYEYIPTGSSLKNMLDTMSVTDYLCYIVQLCFSLQYARDKFDFTHYDLHDDNVLMRKLDVPSHLVMLKSNDTIAGYVLTEYIPTIIDYGMSTCVYKGKQYVIRNKPDVVPYVWADIYKFFMFSMYIIYVKHINDPLFEAGVKMYDYFSGGDYENNTWDFIIETQRQSFFKLPYDDELAKRSLTDFVIYLGNTFPTEFAQFWRTDPPDQQILSCTDGDIMCGIGILPNLNTLPTDPWGLYDFMKFGYWNRINENERSLVMMNIDIYRMMNTFSLQLEIDVTELLNWNKEYDVFDFRDFNKFKKLYIKEQDQLIIQFLSTWRDICQVYDVTDRTCIRLKIGSYIYEQLLQYDSNIQKVLDSYAQWKLKIINHNFVWLSNSINFYLQQRSFIKLIIEEAKTQTGKFKSATKPYRENIIKQYTIVLDKINLLNTLTGTGPHLDSIQIIYNKV